MNKLYLNLLFLLFFCNLAKAQSKALSLFKEVPASAENNLSQEMQNFMGTSKSAKLLNLDASTADLLFNQGGDFNFSIEVKGKILHLRLEETQILGQNFKVFNKKGERKNVVLPRFYKGLIVGDNTSFVTLSILPNAVEGLIAGKEVNFTLGKIKEDTNPYHIIYNSDETTSKEDFLCEVKEVEAPKEDKKKKEKLKSSKTNQAEAVSGCRAIEIFFEADYDLYTKKGSSVSNVADYVTSLFNNVALLYEREGVNIKLNSILVNETPDAYASLTTTADILYQFENTDFSSTGAHLAHFLSTRSLGGGIAYLSYGPSVYGGMSQRSVFSNCDQSAAYGVSGSLSSTIIPIPTYSWNVMVVAHELGHNFGLPHTQSCSWPGGAIDGCVAVEGSCARPGVPNEGGTIMSYCHQTSKGINLSLGFGQMPGDKLRAEVAAATCLGGSASSNVTVSDVYICEPGKVTLTASGCTGGTYQWYDSQTSNTPLGTSNVFVTPTLNSTTYYYVSCTYPANCTSARKKVMAGVGSSLPIVENGAGCLPKSTVSLSASCPSGVPNWFNSNTSTTALAVGNQFETPVLTSTTTYYVRCKSSETCISAPVAVTATITANCYCEEPVQNCSDGDVITSIKISKGSTTIFSNNSSCSSNGYGDYTHLPLSLMYDSTYTISYSSPSSPYKRSTAIWIDFNNDGQFSESEKVLFKPSNLVNTFSATFTVPSTLVSNRVRMRAKIQYYDEPVPCLELGDGYGEVEDYTINFISPCPAVLTYNNPTDNINAGTLNGKSSNSITGSNIISGTASVSYESKMIELLPGFVADSGTTFRAIPEGCN